MKHRKRYASNITCQKVQGGYLVSAQEGRFRPKTFFSASGRGYYKAKLMAKSYIRNNYHRDICKSYA